jgi:hypothetical protein
MALSCINCGRTKGRTHSTLCSACYAYQRVHGQSRPYGANDGRLKHGHKRRRGKSAVYVIWGRMLSRCYNVHSKDYPNYGG